MALRIQTPNLNLTNTWREPIHQNLMPAKLSHYTVCIQCAYNYTITTYLYVLQALTSISTNYRFEELCIAFNGGKDCTVMLDLLYVLLQR